MSISKLFKSILVASFLAATSFAANATTIDFTFKLTTTGEQFGSGNFTGTDVNSDGFLTQDELTSFDCVTIFHETVVLSQLVQFATFDLVNNNWAASSPSPDSYHLWAVWNNGNTGVYSEAFTMTTSIVSPDATVPEPASVALFALGLLGFAAARRRKQ